ncbi:MAG TPA: hypothetical protein VJB88_04555 [Vicinamibacteria bacterium]|nr:hypothetical protein [Vicinamibacteria bacterium]
MYVLSQTPPMWRPSNSQWWVLVIVALLIVFSWPPRDDKSLAFKLVNWAVDPWDDLPILPDQLPLGAGDDPEAVSIHDILSQQYDALYQKGGWTRMRLALKVANDPLNPATERGLLTGLAVMTAFLVWRWGGRKK